jgi:hypothetical protein
VRRPGGVEPPAAGAGSPVQMLSGWPLLIRLLNGPSSVSGELGGSVPDV